MNTIRWSGTCHGCGLHDWLRDREVKSDMDATKVMRSYCRECEERMFGDEPERCDCCGVEEPNDCPCRIRLVDDSDPSVGHYAEKWWCETHRREAA